MKRQRQEPIQTSQTTFGIALAEARALRRQAAAMHAGVSSGRHLNDQAIVLGEKLAGLVTIGLSLELYMKTFMIAARRGRVTPGHDLARLYAEFPAFLKTALEERYSEVVPARRWYIQVIALQLSPDQPEVPTNDVVPSAKYDSFEAAIRALRDSFTQARYFYERVHNRDWVAFDYAVEPGLYAASALDSVFADWQSGQLKGAAS